MNAAARKITNVYVETEHKTIPFNVLFSGEMRTRAEVKATLSMIDREMGNFKSVPELDFRAGYLAGRIEEKKMAGFITPEDAERLQIVLYTKYEIFRRLETEK